MSLTVGSRLGSYEIVGALGAGGMGEVYRATDTKLKRAVAIKVLPAALSSDVGRLARFQREAELLAALNHPNIAQIYGFEEGQAGPPSRGTRYGEVAPKLADGTARAEAEQAGQAKTHDTSSAWPALPAISFIVMELVEGPTLAEILAGSGPLALGLGRGQRDSATGLRPKAQGQESGGGGLPIGEALRIGRQIAEALDTAHEHGIVHRDLKPANIKVREDGTVKVLDFGLAKAIEGAGGAGTAGGAGDPTNSPTITSPAMTHAGMILGTAAYMSPEQARGKAVDARADVWAFGCVLYEMVTGTRPFAGDTVSDVLASVLAREPDWERVPASVAGLLKKCLEKDPKKRLRHIGDWELLVGQPPDQTAGPARRRATSWIWPVTTVIATATAIAIAFTAWTTRATPAESPRIRINPQLPSTLVLPTSPTISVSPDGRRAAIRTRGTSDAPGTAERIWLWSFDAGTATALAGTEGSQRFFWSPDGRYLAAVVGGALRKFDTSGGPAQTITGGIQPGLTGHGGAWSKGNVILLEADGGGLKRLSADGGTLTEVTRPAPGELHHELPTFLPDNRHFLYLRHANPEQMGLFVGDLNAPPPDQPQTRLLAADDGPLYLEDPEGGNGFVLFMRQRELFAQRFDAAALELRGSPVSLAADVASGEGAGWLSASRFSNLLVYGTGFAGAGPATVSLVWVDRSGRETPLPLRPNNYFYPRLSPDGKSLAITQEMERPGERDLWVYNVETGAALRLTHQGANGLPVWAGNGRIAFSSTRDRPVDRPLAGQWGSLYSVRSDGSGEVERMTTDPETSQALSGISPDGRQLFYTRVINLPDHWEITRVDLDKGGLQTPLSPGPFRRSSAEVSPDGGLISYRSDDTGSFEIYVQTYPGLDAKIPVSIGGGDSPVWSADGKEVFYRVGERVMAVEVMRQPTLHAAAPRELFRGAYINTPGGGRQYHVGPDGRFIMLKRVAATASAQPKLVFDLNWFDALRQR